MQLATTIRAASILSYIMGIGTLLALGPSLAYNLATGNSTGSLLRIDPSYGDFLGSNPIGRLWGYPGALVFGLAFLVVAALQPLAGFWLGKSLKRGGNLGATLALCVTALSVGFVQPAWVVVGLVTLVLLAVGWKTLH
jgi:hypothetical protein